MLYGTWASTHFLARLMISARVVVGAFRVFDGVAVFALRPYRGALWPCGERWPSPAGTPGPGGAWGAASAGATWPAPSAVDAAAATMTARRAAGWRTVREYGRTRRQCAHPGQSQSPAGSNSSNTGA